jgi:hypothetical protein
MINIVVLPAGDPFETFNLAIAFPPDVPLGLPQNITASIVRLQVRGSTNATSETDFRSKRQNNPSSCAMIQQQQQQCNMKFVQKPAAPPPSICVASEHVTSRTLLP